MKIGNISNVTTRMNTKSTASVEKSNQVKASFADTVKRKQIDSITISKKNETSSEIFNKKEYYLDDPYNEGTPCGTAAEKALSILAHLRNTADSIDYTGMSDEEIFRAIYYRYDKAFDGNFSGATQCGLNVFIKVSPTMWRGINFSSQMYDEVRRHVSPELSEEMEKKKNSGFMQKFERKALYGDMSEEERWSYISQKYPLKDQTTLEYCSYLSDLETAGLIPEEEAYALRENAHDRIWAKARMNGDDGRTTEAFDRVAQLSVQVRDTFENRFAYYQSCLLRSEDQMKYEIFLDDFLKKISIYRR